METDTITTGTQTSQFMDLSDEFNAIFIGKINYVHAKLSPVYPIKQFGS